jgi:hypothetical protein
MQMDLRSLDSTLPRAFEMKDRVTRVVLPCRLRQMTKLKDPTNHETRGSVSKMIVGPRCLCCAQFMATVLLAKSVFAFTRSALVYGPARSVAARSIRYCPSSFSPSFQRVVGSSVMAPAKTATSTRPRRAATASTAVDTSSQGEKDQKLTKAPKKTLVEPKEKATVGRKRKVTSESSAAKSSKSDEDDVASTETSTSSESPAKGADNLNQNDSSSPPKKAKAPRHQVLTERDELPKLWTDDMAKANGSYST